MKIGRYSTRNACISSSTEADRLLPIWWISGVRLKLAARHRSQIDTPASALHKRNAAGYTVESRRIQNHFAAPRQARRAEKPCKTEVWRERRDSNPRPPA